MKNRQLTLEKYVCTNNNKNKTKNFLGPEILYSRLAKRKGWSNAYLVSVKSFMIFFLPIYFLNQLDLFNCFVSLLDWHAGFDKKDKLNLTGTKYAKVSMTWLYEKTYTEMHLFVRFRKTIGNSAESYRPMLQRLWCRPIDKCFDNSEQ